MNTCNPKGRDNPWSTFYFSVTGYIKTYDLYLYSDDNSNYSCEDNFYGELVSKQFNEQLTKLLKEEIYEEIKVESTFSTVQNEKYDENYDIQNILNGSDKLQNTTNIYVVSNKNKAENTANKIEETIKDNHIYGSFYIEVLNTLIMVI